MQCVYNAKVNVSVSVYHRVLMAVNNRWTGLLEWTTGMDYWTDLFCTKIIIMVYMVPTWSLNQAGAELSTQTSSAYVSSDQGRH